jgi:hypothetical protein
MKYGKMMTCAREAKLISLGFNITYNHDYRVNESKWMKKFAVAKALYKKNGPFVIMPSTSDTPRGLVCWIRKQREELKTDTNLSE